VHGWLPEFVKNVCRYKRTKRTSPGLRKFSRTVLLTGPEQAWLSRTDERGYSIVSMNVHVVYEKICNKNTAFTKCTISIRSTPIKLQQYYRIFIFIWTRGGIVSMNDHASESNCVSRHKLFWKGSLENRQHSFITYHLLYGKFMVARSDQALVSYLLPLLSLLFYWKRRRHSIKLRIPLGETAIVYEYE
jgi:hypothetical protein